MLLRKLADNGQAVLCTIHQPSSQLFRMFDRLLLLSNQGETVYFGDIGQDASILIDYFESRGAPKCRPEGNPAEWVLDVTNKGERAFVSTDVVTKVSPAADQSSTSEPLSWSQRWCESQQYEESQRYLLQSTMAEHVSTSGQSSPSRRSEYAASFTKQLIVVTRRIFQEYWRDPTYLYSKLALCAGVVSPLCRLLLKPMDHPPDNLKVLFQRDFFLQHPTRHSRFHQLPLLDIPYYPVVQHARSTNHPPTR